MISYLLSARLIAGIVVNFQKSEIQDIPEDKQTFVFSVFPYRPFGIALENYGRRGSAE